MCSIMTFGPLGTVDTIVVLKIIMEMKNSYHLGCRSHLNIVAQRITHVFAVMLV